MRKTLVVLLATVLALGLASPALGVSASAYSTQNAEHVAGSPTGWKVWDFNRGGMAFSQRVPDFLANGIASFPFFLGRPDTAYMLTGQPHISADLLGDVGMWTQIEADVAVDASGDVEFEYYNQDGEPGLPATVRLYFETKDLVEDDPAGATWSANYWWSRAPLGSISLAALAADADGTTLVACLNPAEWSDWNGHMATYNQEHLDNFAKAVRNITRIGVTFGGGRHFANGVGVSEGSATFQMFGYEASPALEGDWTLSVNSGAYVHDMVIDSVSETGVITGHGGYPAGDGPPYAYPYNWTMVGQITGSQITMTISYENAYTATISGTIASDWASMGGGAGTGGVANWTATRVD